MNEEERPTHVISFPTIGAKTTTPPPIITMKSNMWLHWGHIAAEHEALAWTARKELVDHWGEPNSGSLLKAEMYASMVAVTSAAFAIDALHFDMAKKVGRDPDPGKGRGKAWGYTLETFRQAVGTKANSWHDEMAWLAELRRLAVHPQPVHRAPEPHPAVPTNTEYEVTIFTCEAATRAVDFLVRIYEAVFLADPGTDETPWGMPAPHVVDALKAKRPLLGP